MIKLRLNAVICLLLYATSAQASLRSNPDNLPPEEFFSIPIYSVSKQKESSFKTPSASYIITSEDIRRSGATSIAESLRLAPGVQVVRVGSGVYRVSVRGFNEAFTNKLLVMIDGRSVYTPLFSGVYWDELDYLMNDIDRIEIIRGSGATLWGSNAVNGIINIITKDASQTTGNLVNIAAGNEEKVIVSARRGKKLDNDSYYRAYAKHIERSNAYNVSDGVDKNNDFSRSQAGFRLDTNEESDNLSLQGDIYKSNKQSKYNLPNISPAVLVRNDKEEVVGGNILAKWEKEFDNDSKLKLQGYVDYVRRDHIILDQERDTYDLELQHIFNLNKKNQISWGAGYRTVTYNLKGTDILHFGSSNHSKSSENLYNIFVQDQINLINNKLYLTLGSKFEYNDYTHFESQPSGRLSWIINDNQTLWGAVARSIRMPSRAEDDLSFALASNGSKYFRWVGNKQLKAEELLSHEMGYRHKLGSSLLLDAAVFYNKYEELKTYEGTGAGKLIATPSDSYAAQYFSNNGEGDVYGVELSVDWKVKDNWQLITSYSHLKMMLNTINNSSDTSLEKDEGESPRHMVNFRSHYTLNNNIEIDNILYYMDALPKVSTGIASYMRFDTRIGWVINSGRLSFNLVGQNLFDSRHQEAAGAVPGSGAAEIGRSIYGGVTYKFW